MHLWPVHCCFETPNSHVKVVKNIIPAYHYALYLNQLSLTSRTPLSLYALSDHRFTVFPLGL
jgi:hypothetical protein